MNQDLAQATWRTSSRSSAQGQCVEVAFVGNTVAARDSKNKPGPVLFFTNDQWRAFVKDNRITPR